MNRSKILLFVTLNVFFLSASFYSYAEMAPQVMLDEGPSSSNSATSPQATAPTNPATSANQATTNPTSQQAIVVQTGKPTAQDWQSLIQSMINKYNAQYHTSITNSDDLQKAITLQMRNYYANLRTCNPGQYTITMPILVELIFATVTISGMQDGICNVTSAYNAGGAMVQQCAYTADTLQLFTDQEAIQDASGSINYNSANLTPLQKAIQTQCKSTLNGKPIQTL